MARRRASHSDLERFASLALELADIARSVSLHYFRGEFVAETKGDSTPVTIADRECEQRMRDAIAKAFPDHGVVGEEHDDHRADASHVWVLDPIDGTKAFVSGRPLFGALVALCRDGRPILGVIDCPAVDDRWVGIEGRPTTHNAMPCYARRCAGLQDALMYSTSPYMFAGHDAGAFEKLRTRVKYPLFGGDCHNYGLLASGWVDLVVEAGMKVHDWAALVPVLEGAGARISDWTGKPLAFDSDGRILVAGDDRIHHAAVKLLDGA